MALADRYQPTASLQRLRDRAKLYAIIRAFLDKAGLMEVTTPSLATHSVSDPYIQSLQVRQSGVDYYLQTSPEFAMKRLLASGSGPIYQICSAFRAGESGANHNPEFTMLEWYQPGYSLTQIMDQVSELFAELAGQFGVTYPVPTTVSYRSLFEARFDINPHEAEVDELKALVNKHYPNLDRHIEPGADAVDQYRDLLFTQGIEPQFQSPTMVTEFPANQAALANIIQSRGDRVAQRFECYWHGMELTNGYDELVDSHELRRRIQTDNQIRQHKGLPEMQVDERLLSAMDQMSASAGVAIGLDRLLMLLTGETQIDRVIAFPIDIA